MADHSALDLAVDFLVGFLGSGHCVGMCGGFVVAVAHAGGRRRAALRQGAYLLGKTSTYAAFGALAGLAGGAAGIVLSGFQGLLSLLLGLVLVGSGLALCGVPRRFAGPPRIGGRAAAVLGGAVRHLVASDRLGAVFGLGAVNGLLPCGLVYGMLAKAATTGNAGAGALTLAVFGLGSNERRSFDWRAGAAGEWGRSVLSRGDTRAAHAGSSVPTPGGAASPGTQGAPASTASRVAT